MNKIVVEIPEHYLLQIATHGNMGSGEFSRLMQMWAEKECKANGLAEKMEEMKAEEIVLLGDRIRNVIGPEAMQNIDEAVKQAKEVIARIPVLSRRNDNDTL